MGEIAWDDIGTLEDYAQANASWLRLHAPEGESFVGEGARVAPGVTLRRSIVGAGACVEGAGSLERCVVWPGATVRAPCMDAVVMGSGVVQTVPLRE